MEAVPRLPMLSCELKISTTNAEFGPALKKYIAEFYHENPESYTREIKEIEALRQSAVKVPRDFTGCRILKRYFSQLQCLQNRFPMSENGAASIAFMWNDLYSGFEYGIMDVQYEQSCILYNIGALHSELGAADCRTNAEGMKVACTHFQCAAWAFQHLRDSSNYPTPRGSDTSRDLLSCFVTLMLAQAQECILEKSMLDSRKSTITAKVAAQVVDYYQSALNILQEGSANAEAGCILDTVGGKIFKHWKKFMEFKMAYYGSISELYMGNQAEEQQKMGERVTWFTAALNKHSEAMKIAKSLDREDLNEALTFTLDVIVGKCNAAKKENDFVYHEKVPSLESLPDIKGGSLVKGIHFDPTDPDICGPDIFARLVPMEAHEASSVYSEEKAKILRNTSVKIEKKEQELVAYMSSLQLDRDAIVPKEETIPQSIVEKCAALSVRPNAIKDVKESLKALTDVFNEVETSIKDVRRILQLEEEREKEHQETFGKRSPSLIVVELTKECSKYEEAHRRGSESNATLQRALELHLPSLEMLASPLDELQRALPSFNLPASPEKSSLVQELRMLLDKVEEMRGQRHQLDNQLRESIQADDITKLLVARDKNQDLQKLFAEQLKKHEQLLSFLDQNLSAQDNILRALTNANARYANTRKGILETMQRREMMVASLLSSYDAYEDLISKAQKGMDFYRKLQTNVLRLQARTKSVTSVQEEERQQISQAQARKANKVSGYTPSTTFQPSASTGPKLKDFLPYMTSNRGRGSSAVSETPPSRTQSPATWSVGSNIPATLNNALPGRRLSKDSVPDSTEIHNDLRSSYSQQTPEPVPMGIRLPPVGSEQVPTSSCMPYMSPAISSSSYSNMDGKDQIWNPQPGSMAYQDAESKMYTSSTAAYQYYQNNQYAPAAGFSQALEYSGTTPTISSSNNYRYNTPNPAAPSSLANQAKQYNYSPSITSATATPQVNNTSENQQYNPSVSNATAFPPYSAAQYGYQPVNNVSSISDNSYITQSTPIPNSENFPATSSAMTPLNYNPRTSDVQYYSDPTKYQSYGNPLTGFPQHTTTTSLVQDQSQFSQYPSANSTSFISQGKAEVSQYSSPSNFIKAPDQPTSYSQYTTPGMVSSATDVSNMSSQSLAGYPQSSTIGNVSSTTHSQQQAGYPQSSSIGNAYSTIHSQSQTGYPQSSTIGSVSSSTHSQQQGGQGQFGDTALTPSGIAANSYTYSNTSAYASQYVSNEIGTSYISGSTPASSYSAMQYPVITPVTDTSITYSTGNQSQYMPGYETSQQTSTVYTYGDYGIMSPYSHSQNTPEISSSSTTNQNFASYEFPTSESYASSKQLAYSSTTASTGYTSDILTPSPSIITPTPPPSVLPSAVDVNTPPIAKILTPTSSVLLPAPSTPVRSMSADISNIDAKVPSDAIQDLSLPRSQPSSTSSSPAKAPSVSSIESDKKEILDPLAAEDLQEGFKPIVQPKVTSFNEASSSKVVESSNSQRQSKDPFLDSLVLEKFIAEVERFKKVVEGLTKKSLIGQTPLDQKWKEVMDSQDKDTKKLSISVARCYPMKNRFPEIMPYDNNRVELHSARNDYINASFVNDLVPLCPKYIVTQAPMPSTYSDFWTMIWEQQAEIVVCLLATAELKGHAYWPTERNQPLNFGLVSVHFHGIKEFPSYVECMLNITENKTKISRVVIHLQFTAWPHGEVPSNPSTFLQFISEVHNYHWQQRNLLRPIVVHCSGGVGRSGVFCVLSSALKELNQGHSPPDISVLASLLCQQRKYLLQEREQLKFCYEASLYHAQDILVKRGILSNKSTFDDVLPSAGYRRTHSRHPSEDFILGGSINTKQQANENDDQTEPIILNQVEVSSESNPSNDSVETPSVQIDQENAKADPPKIATKSVEIPSENTIAPARQTPQSITSILDPSNFTLEPISSPGKQRFTKDSFKNPSGLIQPSKNSSDPLSQLDPLWSLKKPPNE